MDISLAKQIGDAMHSGKHPLLDFRTKEAKKQVKWMEEYIKPFILEKCKFLEVGCGSGKHTLKAEELGAEAVGIDCSSKAIAAGREIVNDINSSTKFVEGNFLDMPFTKESFDIALFPQNIILISYNEMEKLTVEIYRILKENGLFLITMKQTMPKQGDIINGKIEDKIRIPGYGEFNYPTYFWTIPYANHIIKKHFRFKEYIMIKENLYLLAFVK